MAIQTTSTLKSYFQSGQIPTQENYSDFIDTAAKLSLYQPGTTGSINDQEGTLRLTGSIDVTKINKDRLEKGKYLKVSVVLNDEVSSYGDSGYITENQSQEERESKKEKNFIGNVRCVWTNGNNVDVAPKKEKAMTAETVDKDIPF